MVIIYIQQQTNKSQTHKIIHTINPGKFQTSIIRIKFEPKNVSPKLKLLSKQFESEAFTPAII